MAKMVWYGGERVLGTQCEDAPCCGCCGPGSDDPAYQAEQAPDPGDPGDFDREADDGFDGGPRGNSDFWYCDQCGEQNSREDGECQFCSVEHDEEHDGDYED